MNLQKLDLNLLVALDALLTEQSVTRAANRIFLSQPAMSGSLMRLREHFQDELVVRVGRSMVLTPFGARLAPRVAQLLASIGEVIATRPGFDPATSDREFTVVASEYLLAVFLPLVTARVAATAPHVTLDIQLRAGDHEQRMQAGEVDAALTVSGLALPGHPVAPLFEDEYVCVAWQGNDRIGEALTMDDFLACGHAVRSMSLYHSYTLEERWLSRLGHRRQVALRAPTFDSLPRMIVGTELIASMQRRLAEMSAQVSPIRILAHPAQVPPLVALLQWPSFRDSDPGIQWLRQLVQDTAREAYGPPPSPSGAAGD
ncbi:LysR family transcriptional regulator [Ramlibacter sp. AW1]|uniref:LysR family transcriptional regulator n=1 Tax=Ramlibacter aurantiacus TaxID=2801330 RepID=A0A936ZDV1_9BURK|nr:LysR family transcriptional regulator [Ramlibacter aurantiacus]MBL0419127.1 LysR family transcriptional regulator [Ramlibacter aurantiacus]